MALCHREETALKDRGIVAQFASRYDACTLTVYRTRELRGRIQAPADHSVHRIGTEIG